MRNQSFQFETQRFWKLLQESENKLCHFTSEWFDFEGDKSKTLLVGLNGAGGALFSSLSAWSREHIPPRQGHDNNGGGTGGERGKKTPGEQSGAESYPLTFLLPFPLVLFCSPFLSVLFLHTASLSSFQEPSPPCKHTQR